MTLHYANTGLVKVCFAYKKQVYFVPLVMILKVNRLYAVQHN